MSPKIQKIRKKIVRICLKKKKTFKIPVCYRGSKTVYLDPFLSSNQFGEKNTFFEVNF